MQHPPHKTGMPLEKWNNNEVRRLGLAALGERLGKLNLLQALSSSDFPAL
jgi:hypothetical protein